MTKKMTNTKLKQIIAQQKPGHVLDESPVETYQTVPQMSARSVDYLRSKAKIQSGSNGKVVVVRNDRVIGSQG